VDELARLVAGGDPGAQVGVDELGVEGVREGRWGRRLGRGASHVDGVDGIASRAVVIRRPGAAAVYIASWNQAVTSRLHTCSSFANYSSFVRQALFAWLISHQPTEQAKVLFHLRRKKKFGKLLGDG
jgi:hypothetical protein